MGLSKFDFSEVRGPSSTKMSYPVQRSLWEGLESVFLANARNLLRDIANDMSKPEKELLRAFSKDTIQIRLVEEDAKEKECCAITPSNGVAARCRKAVYHDTCYCPLHLRTGFGSQYAYGLPKFRRLKTESGDVYFLDPVTQTLYTNEYKRVGIRKEKKIVLFKIEEPDEYSNEQPTANEF